MDEVSVNIAVGTFAEGVVLCCYEFSPLEAAVAEAGTGLSVHLIDNYDLQSGLEITVPSVPDVEAGTAVQLACEIFPLLPSVSVTYTGDNPDAGTVSSDGLFTAVAPGTVNVTVTANSTSRTFPVTVVPPFVHATALSLADVWVVARTSGQAEVTATPADANLNLAWEVGSTSYAAVDDQGTVTGKAVGQTTLTVTDSISGLTATADINICYPVSAVAFAGQDAEVLTGFDLPLTANVTMRTQSCVNHLVLFTSSDESVAMGAGKAWRMACPRGRPSSPRPQ